MALVLGVVMAISACAKPAPPPTTPILTAPITPESLPPKPASFTSSNLTITPAEINSGGKVTIEVIVTNGGELSGTYDVNLKIDGTVAATENVTLAGGASQKVTFIVSKSTAKTYSVSIDDLSGTFVVKSAPPPPPVAIPPSAPKPDVSTYWGRVIWEQWGFPKDSTPNTKVEYRKRKEWNLENGHKAIEYFLEPNGLPRDQIYYLWVKSGAVIDRAPVQLSTLVVWPFPGVKELFPGDELWVVLSSMSNDILMSVVDNKKIVKGVVTAFGSFAKGEAFEFALTNKNKTIITFFKIIPVPIEATQGRYRLWIELKSLGGDAFIAWAEGFEPGEEIEFLSTSDGEIIPGKVKAGADGRFSVNLLPAVVGKEAGLASFTVKGKAGEVTVSYEWGPPAVRTVQ